MTIILSGTKGVSDVDGSASTPAIRGTDTNTGIFFPAADTIAFAEGGAEVARFNSSGNLGIAVSSPAAKLDVLGDIFARASTLRFKDSGNTTQYGAIYGDSTTFNINGGVNNLIMYSAGTERMRIDSSGNLLIGQTASGGQNSNSIAIQPSTGYSVNCHISGTASGTGYSYFNYNASPIGSITQNGTTGVSYNTSSDYRLKENIAPMTGALGVVQQLKPVTYNWKVDGSTGQGFIAHELQAVVPDCVTGEKDAVDEEGNPQYQGIDTSFLVATLTAALQELNAKVDSLQAELATLKGQA